MAEMTKKDAMLKVAEQTGMVVPKDFSDTVFNSISEYQKNKQLVFPIGYVPENALKSAWLKILETKDKNGALAVDVCSKESIANALLKMVILGLNPAKDQCYPIVYGDKLSMFVSYFGKITALKRISGFNSINANVIYKGDEISFDTDSMGRIYNIKHLQKFENINDNNIIGGYCVIVFNGEEFGQVRTFEQIQEAWTMSKTSSKKEKFRSEFVKRTMVNTTIKWFINTTSDEDLIVEALNETTNDEFDYDSDSNYKQEAPVYNEPKVIIQADDEITDINDL